MLRERHECYDNFPTPFLQTPVLNKSPNVSDVAKTDYKGSEETERYVKEKTQQLRELLQQLQDGTLPEYVNRYRL